MMESVRTITYSDERNDDFARTGVKSVSIERDFPFLHKCRLWKVLAFIVYRLIMTPYAYLHCKLKYRLSFVNRRAFKLCRKNGFFLYRNHTLTEGDAFIPNLACFPKGNYTVVDPSNISVFGTRNFLQMCGAIPVPQKLSAYRGFLNAIEKRILQKKCVTVYPEAHIWPYYTGIREFSPVSFGYPVKFGVPSFVATTTFQQPKRRRTPKVTVYIDGPIYPDTADPKHAAEKLCSEVYSVMKKRSENSTYAAIRYVRSDSGNT